MEVRLIHRQGDVEENEDPANDTWSDTTTEAFLNADEVDGGVCAAERSTSVMTAGGDIVRDVSLGTSMRFGEFYQTSTDEYM